MAHSALCILSAPTRTDLQLSGDSLSLSHVTICALKRQLPLFLMHSYFEAFALLGCYVARVDIWLPTFRDSLSLSSLMVKFDRLRWER